MYYTTRRNGPDGGSEDEELRVELMDWIMKEEVDSSVSNPNSRDVTLARHLTEGTQEEIVRALGALPRMISNEEECSPGVIQAIVTHLTSHSDDTKTLATGALRHLSNNTENKATISMEDVLLPLINMLHRGVAGHKTNAAGLLCSLAQDHSTNDKINKLGGVKPLL